MKTKDLNGKDIEVVIKEWDSTTEPYVVEGLSTGVEYILRETVAPDGYKITTDSTFTIDETGKVTTTATTTTDKNGNTVILVEDTKIDKDVDDENGRPTGDSSNNGKNTDDSSDRGGRKPGHSEAPVNPKTGDENPIGALGVAATVAALGIVAVVVKKKKDGSEE